MSSLTHARKCADDHMTCWKSSALSHAAFNFYTTKVLDPVRIRYSLSQGPISVVVRYAVHALASCMHMTQPFAVYLGHNEDGMFLASHLRAQGSSQELMRGADEQAECWR